MARRRPGTCRTRRRADAADPGLDQVEPLFLPRAEDDVLVVSTSVQRIAASADHGAHGPLVEHVSEAHASAEQIRASAESETEVRSRSKLAQEPLREPRLLGDLRDESHAPAEARAGARPALSLRVRPTATRRSLSPRLTPAEVLFSLTNLVKCHVTLPGGALGRPRPAVGTEGEAFGRAARRDLDLSGTGGAGVIAPRLLLLEIRR